MPDGTAIGAALVAANEFQGPASKVTSFSPSRRTRLVAAGLRAGGIRTMAKTTGSAAVFIVTASTAKPSSSISMAANAVVTTPDQ